MNSNRSKGELFIPQAVQLQLQILPTEDLLNVIIDFEGLKNLLNITLKINGGLNELAPLSVRKYFYLKKFVPKLIQVE